jgi:pimeloyl-ACP methyl ester carboxylesterase
VLRGFFHAWRRARAAQALQHAARVEIATPEGPVLGLLHPAEVARGAVIMVGGSRGGLWGPAGIYVPLANRLQAAGIAALRLEYRCPNRLADCIADVGTAIGRLEGRGMGRVALIGWSFGGAVVIGAGVANPAVIGVATVARQTCGTDMVARLAPKPLLLLHGTADRVLADACSRRLYARAGEPKELVLYPGDDHGLTRHAPRALEKLSAWSTALLSGAGFVGGQGGRGP